MKVVLKRSAPIEFMYANMAGQAVSFTAPACTVGGYRECLRLEVEAAKDTSPAEANARLISQAVALCGDHNRPHIESMDVEMVQEVIQAQVALYSGLEPEAVITVMREVKKKALREAVLDRPFSPSRN